MTAPSANPCRWPPTHRIGAIHLINAVGGANAHHGDDVCGGIVSVQDSLRKAICCGTLRYGTRYLYGKSASLGVEAMNHANKLVHQKTVADLLNAAILLLKLEGECYN